MYDELYYRIIRSSDNDKILTVVCMQWFDENDYEVNRFLCAKGTNDRLMFSTEDEAILFLDRNIKREYIDPAYLCGKTLNDSFYK